MLWVLFIFALQKFTRGARKYAREEGRGGVLPYKGLTWTCGQPGYVFRDFCLEQGIEFSLN